MKRYIRSSSYETDFISEINSIIDDRSLSRTDKRIEVENILEDAEDGCEFYRIQKNSYSGWTSQGGYNSTYYSKVRFVKKNGVWNNTYNGKKDTHDAALSIVYNPGFIYSADEVDSVLEEAKKDDRYSTKEYGLHGKNTVHYPNR